MKSLAFSPINYVMEGFDYLKINSNHEFKPVLEYLEKNYIGKLKDNSKSIRMVQRYPIESWNLYSWIVSREPRTNNLSRIET